MRQLLDKETIYPLQIAKDKNGLQIYLCPRCKKVFKFNIRAVRYCQKCGQHLSPAFEANEAQKENFLASLKVEDLEKGNK